MEQEVNYVDELKEHIIKSKESFSYFIRHIYPLSFKKGKVVKAPHTWNWADRVQNNKRTATLSARKHLKSNTMYAYMMWRLFKLGKNERENWLYMSYNQKMSSYHTENIKQLIQANPLFKGIKDLTGGLTQINYTWDDVNRFTVDPSGILTFNRGWHGDGVIADDILQDPTSELNFAIVEKINRIFMEQIMSLPREGGEIHLVGTAQHQRDLFFKLRDNPGWNWAEYKAIINEANKEVLWPELFSYERLQELRINELGDKAFRKEYMCSPVWSEEAYFKLDELMSVVNKDLNIVNRPAGEWKAGQVVAGLDIGKKSHPSHLAIFQYRDGIYTQIYHKFFDNWDYTKQVEFIKELEKFYLIDVIYYDATRGELESFKEQGLIDNYIWRPIVFSSRSKFQMAANLSKVVNNKTIQLLNSQRMIDSILSVNNDLQAPETDSGHGDAFWSVALALNGAYKGGGYISI